MGENRMGEPGMREGGGEYVIHQIVHSGVSVCTRAPDQQRSGQRSAQRAIKYLSTNPSRHAIRVTIRNSRFARGVTARKYARADTGRMPIYIYHESFTAIVFFGQPDGP